MGYFSHRFLRLNLALRAPNLLLNIIRPLARKLQMAQRVSETATFKYQVAIGKLVVFVIPAMSSLVAGEPAGIPIPGTAGAAH